MTFFANNRKPVFDRRLDFDFLSAGAASTSSVNDVLMMTMSSTLFRTLFSSSYCFWYL